MGIASFDDDSNCHSPSPESRTEGGEAVWGEVGAGAGSEGGQCKAEADAPDKEGAEGTERGRRSEAEVATAAEEERGSVEFGVGVGNEIGYGGRAMDGWTGEEGVAVFGRDPPRAVAGAVADASCSRGAAGSPCRNFDANMIWV